MAASPEQPGPAGLLPLLAGAPEEVAPRLLGAVLRHGEVALRLTEVEAYAGEDDPGSHAYRGPTPRTEVMFGPAGRLYTYFSYGMHVCANVVVGHEGRAAAVLLRAGEVVEGHDVARARRPRSSERDLTRGPARLCQALAITLEHGGSDLVAGPVTLEPGPAPEHWESGPRVGLRGAPERPWRFWLPGEPSVSTYRPAAARPAPSTGPGGRR
ncbi:putative 3-methyladenine DNA glycosylase [Nocardioides sp. OK12]|uniref:DNA-3-methyladenine glycosylase n=1 Tax=Nocardioides sp. OK12 TaxID=2758661 RepID=UPI0021C4BB53|nr:DNA-3-methyladenine glycosylase [Nocardioides sp. OK12]GHJ60897.1 putative 3-methyladenine DNA glycosylase [Nocardioides sp. OK12]